MTRTRYLVFVPALCLVLEQEKLVGKAAARRLTELENGLRESLRTEESLGVIGERAKESLSRYPSSIYWSSLRRLGIFLHPNWGLAYYQAHLAEFHASMNSERDDDGLSHLNYPERRNWDKDLCDTLADGHSIMISEGKMPASLNFALTRHEARYLRAKFKALALQEGRPSILSHLIEQRHANSFSYPWDVPYRCPCTPYSVMRVALVCSHVGRHSSTFIFYSVNERFVESLNRPATWPTSLPVGGKPRARN